ncbi:unnamed protein product [Nezara viridula]|uniref:Neuropeptide n=1 Tax=Nezara viridula TaxID=85310 RepID=A0A9P0H9K6_NEZVI|nr:unnamed protein product [Nezara viridula]
MYQQIVNSKCDCFVMFFFFYIFKSLSLSPQCCNDLIGSFHQSEVTKLVTHPTLFPSLDSSVLDGYGTG